MGMDPVSIALIATAVAGAYTTTEQSKKQVEAANAQTNMLQDQAKKKEKQMKDQNKQVEIDAIRDSQSARLKAMQTARGAYGRSDTILTGPLGLPGGGDSTAKKTLLGA